MKKFLLVFAVFITAFSAFSQDTTKVAKQPKRVGPSPETIAKRRDIDKKFAKYSRDHIVLDLNGTNWNYDKNDARFGQNFQPKWFSRGVNIYFNWDFRIKGSRVSFAPGVGWSCTNIYSRSQMGRIDTGALAGTSFNPIRSYGADTTAKINKLVLQYVDIPLELRIRSDPDKLGNCWKVAIGIKAGIRVDAHTKFKITEGSNTNVIIVRRDPDFNLFHVAPTLRVGYSFFNITATYDLLPVFKAGYGPKANAFSVGISFMAL